MIKKIVLIGIISLGFIACENSTQSTKKKEIKYTASLPLPEWDESFSKRKGKYASMWHSAKKDPIPATQIGYAYSEELKDYDKAIEWYKYSNSMKPMPKNSNYMCYAYQMKKEYEEAIKWCKNAIELGSDEALFQLGTSFSKINDFSNSIIWFKESFNKINNSSAANNIGYIYQEKLKKYNKAKEWYEKAIQGEDMESFHNISRLYHHNLNDDLKASAYSIALIGNKFTKDSVLNTLQKTWKIPNETIKEGYKLQLNSDEFPIKFKGDLGL